MELLIVSVKYHCTCRKKGSHSIHSLAEPEVDILFGKLLQLMLQLLCLFFLLWRLPKKPPPRRLLFEFNYLPHLLPIIYWFCEAFIHIHSILAKSHHSESLIIINSTVSFLCLLPSFSSSRTSADKSSWHVKWHSFLHGLWGAKAELLALGLVRSLSMDTQKTTAFKIKCEKSAAMFLRGLI